MISLSSFQVWSRSLRKLQHYVHQPASARNIGPSTEETFLRISLRTLCQEPTLVLDPHERLIATPWKLIVVSVLVWTPRYPASPRETSWQTGTSQWDCGSSPDIARVPGFNFPWNQRFPGIPAPWDSWTLLNLMVPTNLKNLASYHPGMRVIFCIRLIRNTDEFSFLSLQTWWLPRFSSLWVIIHVDFKHVQPDPCQVQYKLSARGEWRYFRGELCGGKSKHTIEWGGSTSARHTRRAISQIIALLDRANLSSCHFKRWLDMLGSIFWAHLNYPSDNKLPRRLPWWYSLHMYRKSPSLVCKEGEASSSCALTPDSPLTRN